MAGRTFAQARAGILSYLASQGWKVNAHLKVPWAESPNGRLRLWFKPQAVWASEGGHHDLHHARSTHFEDIRAVPPETFLNYVRHWYKEAANRSRTRRTRWHA